MRDGHLVKGERRVSFSQVLEQQRLARADGTHHSEQANAKDYSFRSFGAHFVEVRWDPGISALARGAGGECH